MRCPILEYYSFAMLSVRFLGRDCVGVSRHDVSCRNCSGLHGCRYAFGIWFPQASRVWASLLIINPLCWPLGHLNSPDMPSEADSCEWQRPINSMVGNMPVCYYFSGIFNSLIQFYCHETDNNNIQIIVFLWCWSQSSVKGAEAGSWRQDATETILMTRCYIIGPCTGCNWVQQLSKRCLEVFPDGLP